MNSWGKKINLKKNRSGVSSSSSDDSLSIGNFSMESGMGVSIGSEEEYLIQKLFDIYQRGRETLGECNQGIGRVNAETRDY